MSRYRKLTLISCATALAFGLAACSSSSDKATTTPEPTEPPTPVAVSLPADLPSEYAPAAGSMTIAAGSSSTSGGVVFSCAADGDACMVTVAADGSVSSTGGMVATMLTQAVTDILADRANAATQAMQRTAANNAIAAAQTAVAGVDDDSTDSEISAAEAAIAAAQAAVDAATALTASERAELTASVTAQSNLLAAAKTSRTAAMNAADKAMREAMAKTGKALHAALDANQGGTTALTNIGAPTLAATGLTIDAAAGAGSLPNDTDPESLELKAGGKAGSLGGWMGMDYAHMNATTKIKNEARVYTNQGAAKSYPFSDRYTIVSGQTGENAKNNGYLGSDGSTRQAVGADGTHRGRVMAPLFTHSGQLVHASTANIEFTTRGTYHGAPGVFSCTPTSDTACSSTNDGKGSPSAMGGTWHFKPDAGARVSVPDAAYLYFGWWVSKDKDGGPTAASAFRGIVGDVDGTSTGVSGATLTGSATYAGKAAGKFAMSNPLDGTGNGGHFTADAKLTAKFGSTDAPNNGGMTGTINNFRLNDGSADPGWSVALHRATWGDLGAISASTANTANTTAEGTTWSINGNAATESGTWSGHMYDEMPGNPPAGDGSNLPTTVIGTFYSEFSTIGRMVGGFGASKQ